MTTKAQNDMGLNTLVVKLKAAIPTIEGFVKDLRAAGYRRDLSGVVTVIGWMRSDSQVIDDALQICGSPNFKIKQPNPKRRDTHSSIGVKKLRRHQEFENCSGSDAIRKVLESSLESLTREEIVRKIFVIGDDIDLKRALQSAGSELSSGARKGFWKSVGNGHYRCNSEKAE
jgi:hypothetical protein